MSSSSSSPASIAGKVVVVTGATGGFGQAFVTKFVGANANVVAVDINEAAGQALEAAHGRSRVLFLRGDVTSAETWTAIREAGIKAFGKVDVVINNAGSIPRNQPTHTLDMALFEKTYNLNVKPIFLSCQAFMPYWLERRASDRLEHSVPVMINIGSTGGVRPRAGMSVYCSSKGAVALATQALAAEYGPDVRVVNIAPFLAPTAMMKEVMAGKEDTPENRKPFTDQVPMRRLCEVTDVANMAAFLASDEASYLTGDTYLIDGGRCI